MKFLDYEKLGLLSEALASKEVGDKVLVGRIEAYSCKPAGDDRKLIKELGSTFKEEVAAANSTCNSTTTSYPINPTTSTSNTQHLHQHHHISSSNSNNPYSSSLGCSIIGGPTSPRIPSGSGFRTGSMPASASHFPFYSSSSTSSPLGDLSDASTRKLLINLIATMNAAFPDYDFSGVRPEQFMREPDLRLTMNDVNRHLVDLCEIISPTFLEELWAAIDEAVVLKDCEVFSYLPDMDGDPFSDGNLWSFNYFFVNRKVKRIVFFTCMAKSKFQSMDEEREDVEDSPMRATIEDWRDEDQYWVDL